MAKIIQFYIPTRYQKKVKWVPPADRGKVLEFRAPLPKSA